METALAENPHLEIDAYVAENSRLGFRAVFAGMHPAIDEVKSNNVSGVMDELRRDGIRSRSTGKERDTETGLDFFEARYLSAAQGRFISPDPVSGSIFNPQTFNLYAYVWNNPLRHTDPIGMVVSWEDSEAKCEKGETTCLTGLQRKYEKRIRDLQNSKNAKDRSRGDALAATYKNCRMRRRRST